MTRETEQWVDEETGIPGRLTTLSGADADFAKAVDDLWAKGCGAWVGRTACGDPPVVIVIGQTKLMFMSYRAVVARGMSYVVACERHSRHGGSGDFAAFTHDMPRPFRRQQEKERQKFLRLVRA